GAAGRSQVARQRAALRRPAVGLATAERGAGGTAGRARVRQPAPDRQRGAVHHAPLLREPAGGAGAGRGAGSHRRRRVRRRAAGGGGRGGAAVSAPAISATSSAAKEGGPRAARAFAPASVANVAVGFDLLGYALAG